MPAYMFTMQQVAITIAQRARDRDRTYTRDARILPSIEIIRVALRHHGLLKHRSEQPFCGNKAPMVTRTGRGPPSGANRGSKEAGSGTLCA